MTAPTRVPPDSDAGSPGLIAVVGATGTGKSELSLAVAESIIAAGGTAEIVNADAMQLYKGMDIGTAKLGVDERRGIPHHLLDVLEVTEDASVAAYQPMARRRIDEITARGGTAILVGGSGLYVSSVLFDFAFPPRDAAVRARLEADAERWGSAALFERLRAADPRAAERIDPANTRRVVRALEVHELGAGGHGGALPDAPTPWRASVIVGLRTPRRDLTARLDARVCRMWRDGLVEEVSALREAGLESDSTAGRAIGYAQASGQLDGRLGETDAIAETQQLTRRYARRQVSWFRRYENVHWFDADGGVPTRGVLAALGLSA